MQVLSRFVVTVTGAAALAMACAAPSFAQVNFYEGKQLRGAAPKAIAPSTTLGNVAYSRGGDSAAGFHGARIVTG